MAHDARAEHALGTRASNDVAITISVCTAGSLHVTASIPLLLTCFTMRACTRLCCLGVNLRRGLRYRRRSYPFPPIVARRLVTYVIPKRNIIADGNKALEREIPHTDLVGVRYLDQFGVMAFTAWAASRPLENTGGSERTTPGRSRSEHTDTSEVTNGGLSMSGTHTIAEHH